MGIFSRQTRPLPPFLLVCAPAVSSLLVRGGDSPFLWSCHHVSPPHPGLGKKAGGKAPPFTRPLSLTALVSKNLKICAVLVNAGFHHVQMVPHQQSTAFLGGGRWHRIDLVFALILLVTKTRTVTAYPFSLSTPTHTSTKHNPRATTPSTPLQLF